MTKILVIEDETYVRDFVIRLLDAEGYETIQAAYGQIGYSKAVSENPDLILLDLIMPVMDGLEVLRKLKRNLLTGPIPVIILTARIDAGSERECMQAGAVDYIKKPWGHRELEDRVRLALDYQQDTRQNHNREYRIRRIHLDT